MNTNILAKAEELQSIIRWKIFHGKIDYLQTRAASDYAWEEPIDFIATYVHDYKMICYNVPILEEEDNELLAQVVFHEMLHSWCSDHGIKSTKGNYHTAAFKKAAEKHGAECRKGKNEDGYCITLLNEKDLKEILAEMKT